MTIDERIWLSELQFSSSRSSGAGGQHVNKVESKVEVRWNVVESKAISDEKKALLLLNLTNKLTSNGDIILYNQTSRSQVKNKQAVLEALKHLIEKASHVRKIRKKSKPSQADVAERLEDKKRRSVLKQSRSKPQI